MSYLISLAAGLGVGLLYWALRVQSPAPPLIALTGLLGMVIGEHAIPVVQAHFFAAAAPSDAPRELPRAAPEAAPPGASEPGTKKPEA